MNCERLEPSGNRLSRRRGDVRMCAAQRAVRPPDVHGGTPPDLMGVRTLRFGAGHQGRIRASPDVPDFSRGAQWSYQGAALGTDLKEVHQPRNASECALGRRVGVDRRGGLGSRHADSGGSAGRCAFTLE